ncbi:MAG: hypothetical protein HC890_12620 [Chloroflexaceae bacterium]|nr:hypothetical protein [Chloroflexaceae bacterium]
MIHLTCDAQTLACGKPFYTMLDQGSFAVSTANWNAVDCPDCRATAVWRELAGLPNPRNAGRKPGNFMKTHQKVTVHLDDWNAYARLGNKSEFIRDAIREKLKRDRAANP